MSPEDFNFISKMLKERSGLSLSTDKGYLMESRLMPVARKNGMSSLDELVEAVRGKDLALQLEVVEAMTTNESFFFRDSKPFNQFKDLVLPTLLKTNANKRSIRIWSAACSSGQEPYSLAMILKEAEKELKGWKIDIIATDISQEIIDKAMRAEYTQFEVQRGLPVQYLIKHFKKEGESWTLGQDIKSMVQFKKWNLLDDYKALGTFDVVFCRNVLIYFDQPTKTKVLGKIADGLQKEGFLYLGGAETVLGISNRFKPVPGQRGIYAINVGGQNEPLSIMPASMTPKVSNPNIKSPASAGVRPTMSSAPAAKKTFATTNTAVKRPAFGAVKPTTPTAAKPASSLFKKPASTTNTTATKPASSLFNKPSSTTNTTATKTTSSLFNKPASTTNTAATKPTGSLFNKPASTTDAKRPAFSANKPAGTTNTTATKPTNSLFNRPASTTDAKRPAFSANKPAGTTNATATRPTGSLFNRPTASTTKPAPKGPTVTEPSKTIVAPNGDIIKERVEITVNEKGQKVRKIIRTVVKKAGQ
jgi:chemotaxis protein methyltransferase CheR